MLIPGTNIPIKIIFDESIEPYKKLVATLWSNGKKIEEWGKDDMTVLGNTVLLPLHEDKTKKYKKGKAKLLIKGLNLLDEVVFYEEAIIQIGDREDKEIDLIEED